MVDNGSLAVPEARITHLAQYHLPKTKRDLKSFLGLVSYYRRFIPNLVDSTTALTSATVARAPDAVVWTSARLEAFHLIRKSLCCHTTLTIPVSSDSFVLHTDASGVGVGTILNVIRNDSVLPVSFYSRQLRGPEHNYSATEKEALAICCAVQNF